MALYDSFTNNQMWSVTFKEKCECENTDFRVQMKILVCNLNPCFTISFNLSRKLKLTALICSGLFQLLYSGLHNKLSIFLFLFFFCIVVLAKGAPPEEQCQCPSHQFACPVQVPGECLCIPSKWRCDQDDDCGDNTDEEGCGKRFGNCWKLWNRVIERRKVMKFLTSGDICILTAFLCSPVCS